MKVVKALVPVILGFLLVTVLVLELIKSHPKRKTVIGTLCAVFAVAMYISPLTVMVHALHLAGPMFFSNYEIYNSALANPEGQPLFHCCNLAEDGNPDPQCGVHAIHAISLQFHQWPCVVWLRFCGKTGRCVHCCKFQPQLSSF